jgi:hypothetical protein
MQLAGMQHQSQCPFGARYQETTIQVATQNRVAQLLAVNTQLMGAPGLRG